MREYPRASQYIEKRLQEAARRYAEGLRRTGLEPNETLTRAVGERAAKEAVDSYMQEMNDTLEHNIRIIIREERRRTKQIQREGASLALKICPPIILAFGALAGLYVSQHSITLGLIYGLGALAFLTLLILAWISAR